MLEHLTPPTVFKCLADETRTRLMLLIAAEGELCVCELTAALELSQPKISRHLAQLRTGGMLADRRQGQWVYYRLHPTLASNRHWLSADSRRLQQMGERPERNALCCSSAAPSIS